MKLTEREAHILAAIELRAEAPIELIRKQSGYREHTIRYAIRRLIERGVITPIPFVNIHRLGFTVFNIFFSIGAERKATKDALLRAFAQSADVVWIGEFGGEYQYGIAVCTRHVAVTFDLLKALSKRFQNVFFEKAVSCQSTATTFPRKYLGGKKIVMPPLSAGYSTDVLEIDDLDAKILTGMASDGGLSHRQLALKLQMPLSTLELRISKLEKRGVVGGYFYAVNPAQFDMQSYKLLVYCKGLNPDFGAALYKFCAAHLNVTYLIECLGNWDFEVGVEVRRTEEVTAIIQEMYELFGGSLHTIKILTKFRDVKFRWFPGGIGTGPGTSQAA